MADVFTPAKQLNQQTIGEHPNEWGGILNTNFGLIDAALGGTIVIGLTGDLILSGTSIQSTAYRFTGALSQPATVTFPAFEGLIVIRNDTTQILDCGITGNVLSTIAAVLHRYFGAMDRPFGR